MINEIIEQPFPEGQNGSKYFRIPSLTTLQDGSVFAACDMRYTHGSDSPQNLDVLIARSADGRTGWKHSVVNRFEDFPDGVDSKKSASFIDPSVVQSKKTGRIFLICDAFPSGFGAPNCRRGTGFYEQNGKKYLALTKKKNLKKFSKFDYYADEFDGKGMAAIYSVRTGKKTKYSVDREYYLYKGKNPRVIKQKITKNPIHANVFFRDSEFSVYGTMYLWMRYSDDNGETWSKPEILSAKLKNNDESFFGICPGRGMCIDLGGGAERILFFTYDNSTGAERVSTIYSDDNGTTWQRGVPAECAPELKKTSETQGIILPDGRIRAFARTDSFYIGCADSFDGGISFSKFMPLDDLKVTRNCMVSFVGTPDPYGDAHLIIGTFGTGKNKRADGVMRVYRLTDDYTVEAVKDIPLFNGFFAYSCMTVLPDDRIAVMYENDYNGLITYDIIDISEEPGNIV